MPQQAHRDNFMWAEPRMKLGKQCDIYTKDFVYSGHFHSFSRNFYKAEMNVTFFFMKDNNAVHSMRLTWRDWGYCSAALYSESVVTTNKITKNFYTEDKYNKWC